ncbi:hypothetical protein CAEBREN_10005 [Caenorhabditis brenneri]|uniref:G-protein coupled receptors family 1 profile domain-containing protein n=1 Tax=Caenorhabditis brenneri TaxID=135651 RepID=G0NSW5_CAEBE|nr:hypothetical protein CAEBREN_10005 [Caenorhabditis brenneri]
MSVWLAVLMALIRSLSILFPMSNRVQKLTSPKYTIVCCFAIFAFWFVFHVWPLLLLGYYWLPDNLNEEMCGDLPPEFDMRDPVFVYAIPAGTGFPFDEFANSWDWLIKLTTLFLYFVSVIAMVIKLRSINRKRKTLNSRNLDHISDNTTALITVMTVTFLVSESVTAAISIFTNTTGLQGTQWLIGNINPNWEPQPILHRSDPYGPHYNPSRIKNVQTLIGLLEFIGSVFGSSDDLPLDYFDDQYCMEYNFLEATESFRVSDDLEPVSLVTHGTSDMLKHFENMPKMWDGPISIGVFIDFDSQQVLQYLTDLHQCDEQFSRKVTVHFAYRKSAFQKECLIRESPKTNTPCQKFLRNKVSYAKKIPSPFFLYPYNLMRNLARKGAKSDLHFLMDGDMIVSNGMAEKVKTIANEMLDGNQKNVLLVRRFESEKGTVIPRTVSNLKVSMSENKTFEFHQKFWFSGHQIKNLPGWFEKSKDNMEVTSWEIDYSNTNWEPQPILHRNAPYGPNYIPSRLKDVPSTIYKLCRAGYTFHVLSHVFTVHEGVKLDNTIFSQAVAIHQHMNAKDRYVCVSVYPDMIEKEFRASKRYTLEINAEYPDTLEKCGEFYL